MDRERSTGILQSEMDHFCIQAGSPRRLPIAGPEPNLSDAIESVFPMETEAAFLGWKHVFVPLSYKYDLSLMVDDAVNVIEQMRRADVGRTRIDWPSSNFAARWDLRWSDGMTTIDAEWHRVVGGLERILAPRIEVSTHDFISEWKMPLNNIIEALLGGAVDLQVESFVRLRAVLSEIPVSGFLYR